MQKEERALREKLEELQEVMEDVLRLMSKKEPKKEELEICMMREESAIRKKIKELLQEMEIQQRIRGFHYLIEAIYYYYKNRERIFDISVTKELYPKIAKIYGTTAQRVERAIRHAIETINMSSEEMEEMKKKGLKFVLKENGKVTNNEFIMTITNYFIFNLL